MNIKLSHFIHQVKVVLSNLASPSSPFVAVADMGGNTHITCDSLPHVIGVCLNYCHLAIYNTI